MGSGDLLRQLPGIEAGRRGPFSLHPQVRGLFETNVEGTLHMVRLAAELAPGANRNAVSDLGVAAHTGLAAANGAVLSGMAEIAGWAIDDRDVTDIAIHVDGQVVGHTTPTTARQDVANAYPGSPGAPHHGFAYSLDTTALSNGPHTLTVWVSDAAGNTALMPPGAVSFTVGN